MCRHLFDFVQLVHAMCRVKLITLHIIKSHKNSDMGTLVHVVQGLHARARTGKYLFNARAIIYKLISRTRALYRAHPAHSFINNIYQHLNYVQGTKTNLHTMHKPTFERKSS